MIGIIMEIIKIIINTASLAIFLHLILRNENRLPNHSMMMNIFTQIKYSTHRPDKQNIATNCVIDDLIADTTNQLKKRE